jgi:hypothetical protein
MGPGVTTEKIGNGLVTSSYPSVGLFLTPIGGYCTATLIGCQTALTAAHCVCRITSSPDPQAGIDCGTPRPADSALLFLNSGVYEVASISVNRSWIIDGPARHDLALLHLAEPVAGVRPASLNLVAKPDPGTPVSLVGFGPPVGEATPLGIKRSEVDQLTACLDGYTGALCYDIHDPVGPPGRESRICGGDSGGPMFVAASGNVVLAGVTSGGLGPGTLRCTTPHQRYSTDVFTERFWIQAEAGTDLGQATCGLLPSAGSALAPSSGAAGTLSFATSSQSFTYEVSPGTDLLNVILSSELPHDFDLYVKLESPAGPTNFDCSRETRGASIERCVITSPPPGTWSLTATRFFGEGAFQITATAFKSVSSQCVRDAQTACLQNDRFEVKVSYANSSSSGSASVMSFGGQRAENRESAFYSFASPTNFEIGLKVLEACTPPFGNKFWVFVSGLTDQAWTLTVREPSRAPARPTRMPSGTSRRPRQTSAHSTAEPTLLGAALTSGLVRSRRSCARSPATWTRR